MSYTQDFFTSRNNKADGQTQIGQRDRLWYDPVTNTIRVSDGVTPGGIIVSGGGSGGGGIANVEIQYQGVTLTSSVASINFAGNAVIATAAGDIITVQIDNMYGDEQVAQYLSSNTDPTIITINNTLANINNYVDAGGVTTVITVTDQILDGGFAG